MKHERRYMTSEIDKYKDIDWLPQTNDGHRIYPGKEIYVLDTNSETHRSGVTVAWQAPVKHTVRNFWIGPDSDTDPIGVSQYEEFDPKDCYGSYDEAKKVADEMNEANDR